MPIYRFIHPETNIIIEQFRSSIIDATPFIQNGVEFHLHQIVPDANKQNNDILYDPLMIKAIRAIILDSKHDKNAFLKDLHAILNDDDRSILIKNALYGNVFSGFGGNDIGLEKSEHVRWFTDPERVKSVRREAFGAEEVDVELSERAGKVKKVNRQDGDNDNEIFAPGICIDDPPR